MPACAAERRSLPMLCCVERDQDARSPTGIMARNLGVFKGKGESAMLRAYCCAFRPACGAPSRSHARYQDANDSGKASSIFDTTMERAPRRAKFGTQKLACLPSTGPAVHGSGTVQCERRATLASAAVARRARAELQRGGCRVVPKILRMRARSEAYGG